MRWFNNCPSALTDLPPSPRKDPDLAPPDAHSYECLRCRYKSSRTHFKRHLMARLRGICDPVHSNATLDECLARYGITIEPATLAKRKEYNQAMASKRSSKASSKSLDKVDKKQESDAADAPEG